MTRTRCARLGVLLAAVTASAVLAGADDTADADRSFLRKAVDNRLAIGLRLSHSWLEDSRRYGENGLDNGNPGNFLGSLWGLDLEQRAVPCPFLEYRVVSIAGLGVGYDETRIRTLDWGTDDDGRPVTAGDGDLRLRGVQVYAFARYPNRTRVTPQARLGWSHYSSAFFENPGWAQGGKSFDVQDTSGWFVAAGVGVRVWRGAGLDLSFEHLALGDVRAKARLGHGGHRNGAFPVRRDTLSLGLGYRF